MVEKGRGGENYCCVKVDVIYVVRVGFDGYLFVVFFVLGEVKGVGRVCFVYRYCFGRFVIF